MSFRFRHPLALPREIQTINRVRAELSCDEDLEPLTTRTLKEMAEHYVSSLGWGNAIVDFVRSDSKTRPTKSGIYTHLALGSSRIPLELSFGDTVVVAKGYDDSGDEELEVLELLLNEKPEFAPHIYSLFKDFYVEERIDRSASSLEFLAERAQEQGNEEGLMQILTEGVSLYGDVFSFGIDYSHNHWLDEIYLKPDGKLVLCDFGTAELIAGKSSPGFWTAHIRLFYQLNSMKMRERMTLAKANCLSPYEVKGDLDGLMVYFAAESGIHESPENRDALTRYKDAICPCLDLDDPDSEWIRLHIAARALRSMVNGIKEHFETSGSDLLFKVSGGMDAWAYTNKLFPFIVDCFTQQ